MRGSETVVWRENEIIRITAVEMNKLRSSLGIVICRIPNARIRDLRGLEKGLNERSDEGVLRLLKGYTRWSVWG